MKTLYLSNYQTTSTKEESYVKVSNKKKHPSNSHYDLIKFLPKYCFETHLFWSQHSIRWTMSSYAVLFNCLQGF